MRANESKNYILGSMIGNESYQEDPEEEYKREFKRKKAEERRLAAERKLRLRKIEFKILRWLSLPILIAGIFLLLDYWLPAKVYEEEAVTSWQETRGGRRFRAQMAFVRTSTFVFDAPPEVEERLNYDDLDRSLFTIETTPFLETVKTISVNIGNELLEWEPDQTIYNNVPLLPYLLTLSALFTWVRKEFNEINYWLSISPPLLLAVLILIAILGV
jgi:hypothetical protein